MKKIFTIILLCIFCISLIGCSDRTSVKEAEEIAEAHAERAIKALEDAQNSANAVDTTTDVPVTKEESVKSDDGSYEEYTSSLSRAEKKTLDSIDSAITKLLDSKVDYYYKYTSEDVVNEQFQYKYRIKDGSVKIIFKDDEKLSKDTTQNFVYYPTLGKSGNYYCEHRDMDFCYDGAGPFNSVDFDKYYQMNPHEWYEFLGSEYYYAFEDTVDNYKYYVVDFKKDSLIYRTWVNNWNGWPIKIKVYEDVEDEPIESYQFDDFKLKIDDINV